MGMHNSGTPAFDATSGPGKDTSANDAVVRTHDTAAYIVSLGGTSQTNGYLVLKIGATTLPGSYTGPASPQIARFEVVNFPTGAAGCQGIVTAAMTAPVAGQSGVSADGQTLYCALAAAFSAIDATFIETISSLAPNGATVDAPIVTFSSNQTVATSAYTPSFVAGSASGNRALPDDRRHTLAVRLKVWRRLTRVPG